MILGSGLIQSAWPKASDWLIKDEFTDTVAAGSVNGTAATPGPGTRVVVDADSSLSIGGGVASLAASDGIWYEQLSAQNGLAVIVQLATVTGPGYLGWDNNQSGISVAGSFLQNLDGNEYVYSSGIETGQWNGTETYAVLRGNKNIWMKRVSGSWKIFWIQAQTVGLYPFFTVTGGTSSVNYLRAIALPAPFDTDDGLATDTHSGSVAAGTTFTHEADCLIEATITTVPSADNIDIVFRQQDASNYWICRVNLSGDISLQEVVAGTPTQRGVAAGVVSNGHRVVVIADGTTIKGYSNKTLRWTYSSATNFATSTAGEVDALGTGGVVSNVKTWPLTLSGTAASILNKASG